MTGTQSRRHSLVESVASTAIGFLVSLALTAVVLPAYGHAVTASQNVQITLIFTVASIARSYAVRRFFNNLASLRRQG